MKIIIFVIMKVSWRYLIYNSYFRETGRATRLK